VGLVAAGAVAALFAPGVCAAVPDEAALLLGLAAGLPHGAGDHLLAPRRRRLALAAAYVAVVATAVATWWWMPGLYTLAFVGLSAWHFGQGDLHGWEVRRGWEAPAWLTRGAVMLGLPLLQPEAWPILEAMAGSALPRPPIDALALVTLHAVVLLAALPRHRWVRALAELTALSVWLAAAPPLVGFALVFAVWHSWPHLVWMRSVVERSWPELLLGLAGPTLLSALAVAAVRVDLHTALVAISALTFPHALLVDRLVHGHGPAGASSAQPHGLSIAGGWLRLGG
jgi:beta-carotene 15,15'-dioxygenase